MYKLTNMAEKMNVSLPSAVNTLDDTERSYTEVVNISLDNTASKKFMCNYCDFKGNDKGGMKRHVKSKHKASRKHERDEENAEEQPDEKKPKTDQVLFNPESTSTQVSSGVKLNRTASQLSNESLMFIFSEQGDFTELNGCEDDDKLDEPEAESDSRVSAESDLVLLNVKIKKLEEEIKRKTLETVEKDGIIETMENENYVLKEEIVSLKELIQVKDTAHEASLSKVNDLEEYLKREKERVKILEPIVNKYLKKQGVANLTDNENDEVKSLKTDLKAKSQLIKELNAHKSELANELKDLQEKANNSDKHDQDALDKCVKLTSEVNIKKSEIKVLDKENKTLTATVADLQKKLSECNSKLSTCQVDKVRLQEQNSHLFDLVKRVNSSQPADSNSPQSRVEEAKLNTVIGSSNESSPQNKVHKKKCRFFERGYCKKNPCNFFHPSEVCTNFSLYGQCSLGQTCRLRHPQNVCMKFLEGLCNLGLSCAHQHPANRSHLQVSPSLHTSAPPRSPSLPYPPQSPTKLPYPRVYQEPSSFQRPTPVTQHSTSSNLQYQSATSTSSPSVMSNQVFW